MFSRSKQTPPAGHHTSSNPGDRNQSAERHDDKPLEQYVFESSPDAIVETEAIFHLGTENLSHRATKQVLFSDASRMHIKGGFFGAGSQSVAIQIAANHQQRQMAQDSARINLEMRRLELEERRLQFEMRMHQSMFLHFSIRADVEFRRETTFPKQALKYYIRSETYYSAYCHGCLLFDVKQLKANR
jgi:hypothetical protein